VRMSGPLHLIAVSVVLLSCTVGSTQEELAPIADDGTRGAPVGVPISPDLLLHYSVRPRWRVAGVDYPVGIPSGTELKDPAALSMPGVEVDFPRHVARVVQSGITLSGYDFSLAGGWTVYIDSGTDNITIEKSQFRIGLNDQVPINAVSGSGSVTIQYNSFDGGYRPTAAAWTLINFNGSGRLIAQYNCFLNAPEDGIDFSGGAVHPIVQYNYFSNLGTAAGSHPDPVQFIADMVDDYVEQFNTIYQPPEANTVRGMQGVQIQADGGSRIRNAIVRNNVIVAAGPTLTMSYAIALIQSPGNRLDGVLVADNFIDRRGAYGAFYPPSGTNLIFRNNIDLRTGEVLMPGRRATWGGTLP
jgi:hypothetical protein